jgi:hypothetical protein
LVIKAVSALPSRVNRLFSAAATAGDVTVVVVKPLPNSLSSQEDDGDKPGGESGGESGGEMRGESERSSSEGADLGERGLHAAGRRLVAEECTFRRERGAGRATVGGGRSLRKAE